MNMATLATRSADADIGNSFVMRQLRIGSEYFGAGQIDEAISAYRRGLAEIENGPRDCVPADKVAELHSRLGDAGLARGDLELAATNYKAALRLAPDLTSCWCNLGNVYLRRGCPLDAITLYAHALSINPVHWASRANSVQALIATHQYILAQAVLTELMTERPRDAALFNQCGKLHVAMNDPGAALACFQDAVELDPRDFDSLYWIGGLKQKAGEDEAAEAAYARAAQLQPFIRRRANRFPAEFRVLALFAPFAGNTPSDYLFKDAAYDTDTLALFPDVHHDLNLLRGAQVIVNLISDADQANGLLPLAADLADQLGMPVVNDPRKIEQTTRENVVQMLGTIPRCRIPKVLRHGVGAEFSVSLSELGFPVLVRPAGTHGGTDFEKIEGPAELESFLSQRPDADHYVIEYIDYRSADGHFRKYRFMFVGEEILPYHLAIGEEWKVHHDSTDMEHHDWMQREEEAFLNDPAVVFGPEHFRVLQTIQRSIGLDFFGIDCGLDQLGNLVVFEVNASMLVHEENDKFPYKNAFVARIKRAFDKMLRGMATKTA
ncbi:MAG: tetratricopeptide repeat protein [Proteobacteria bacterium]|nr:tetratricopeptide repeat protein [Pseudomonadota bacterium]